MFAAAAGDIEVVTKLIELGADVDAADQVKSSAAAKLPLQIMHATLMYYSSL